MATANSGVSANKSDNCRHFLRPESGIFIVAGLPSGAFVFSILPEVLFIVNVNLWLQNPRREGLFYLLTIVFLFDLLLNNVYPSANLASIQKRPAINAK